jgi:hypothetical protein
LEKRHSFIGASTRFFVAIESFVSASSALSFRDIVGLCDSLKHDLLNMAEFQLTPTERSVLYRLHKDALLVMQEYTYIKHDDKYEGQIFGDFEKLYNAALLELDPRIDSLDAAMNYVSVILDVSLALEPDADTPGFLYVEMTNTDIANLMAFITEITMEKHFGGLFYVILFLKHVLIPTFRRLSWSTKEDNYFATN